jgi:hypothetical protein
MGDVCGRNVENEITFDVSSRRQYIERVLSVDTLGSPRQIVFLLEERPAADFVEGNF